jgi:hypothetical protein
LLAVTFQPGIDPDWLVDGTVVGLELVGLELVGLELVGLELVGLELVGLELLWVGAEVGGEEYVGGA